MDFEKLIDIIFGHEEEEKREEEEGEEKEKNCRENGQSFYNENIVCSREKAKNIFGNTLSQSASSLWFAERLVRISASSAHCLAHARTNETCLKYFRKKPFTCPAMEYGKASEPLALKRFTQYTGAKVFPSGLVISNTNPWLCGTPDGLFSLDTWGLGEGIGVLEIKCPYSCRDAKKIDVPYINWPELKKNHPYYTQVQLQMYLCNAKFALFYVFSPADSQLIKVERDNLFIDALILKLKNIYFDVLLPTIS